MEFNDKNTSDFKVVSKDKIIYCHKSVVSKNIYIKTYIENKINLDVNVHKLILPCKDFDSFKLIILSLYQPIELNHLNPKQLVNLYHIADKYLEFPIKNKLLELLDSFDYYQLAEEYNDNYTKGIITQSIIDCDNIKDLIKYYQIVSQKKDQNNTDLILNYIKNSLKLSQNVVKLLKESKNQQLIEAKNFAIKQRYTIKVDDYLFKKLNTHSLGKKNSLIICIIGIKLSGKTTLVNHLLRELKIHSGIFLENESNSQAIIQSLDNIISKQSKIRGKIKFCLVLDCISIDVLKSEKFKYISSNSKSLGITLIITIQSIITLAPNVRDNIDYYFLANQQTSQIEIHSGIESIIPSFPIFQTIFDHLTNNHNFMVLNNIYSTNNIEKMISWYNTQDNC